MPTFVPYLLVAGVLFFLYLGEQDRIKNLSVNTARWLAYILLWIFIGLRGHIMSDFIGYVPLFESIPDIFHLSTYDFLTGYEPGFIVYTAIIKLFTDNYFTWVAFNTLIDLIVLAWFFHRYCKSMILPLIFLIAFNGLLIEFNLYRNVKAIDLFLLSIPYLQDRKLIPYMLLNILGVTFHTSALLYIPLYFILYKKMSIYVVWSGFIISNIVFLLQLSIIGNIINNLSLMQSMDAYDKIMRYSSNSESYGLSFGYIERLLTFVLFYSFYKSTIQRNPSYIIFYNCFWIYYCSILIFYEVVVFTERIPYLFMFSYWILYPNILSAKNNYRVIIRSLIYSLVILKILATYKTQASSYSNIIFTNPDYDERKYIIEQEFASKE